jgi:SAM-dependent methyltransferase
VTRDPATPRPGDPPTTRPQPRPVLGQPPADVAPDGSPVVIYRALPAEPSFTPFLAVVRPPATVLDLGCGTGRLANLLAARGFAVTGVDAAPAMLAALAPAVHAVEGRIEEVRLGTRFDVVVLASQLVNDPDPDRRQALLATAREHVTDDGAVYLEHLEEDLLAGARTRDATLGRVAVSFRIGAVRGREFDGEVHYRLDGRTWTQRFTSVVLDAASLERELVAVGLTPRRGLSPSWLRAAPAPAARTPSSAGADTSEGSTRPPQEERP